jgi:hypothetical protein
VRGTAARRGAHDFFYRLLDAAEVVKLEAVGYGTDKVSGRPFPVAFARRSLLAV